MQTNLEIPHEPISIFLVEEPSSSLHNTSKRIYNYHRDSNDLHFPESPKVKVEVSEIKTEPCDLSSEESESLYNQNATSEEEDVSSDKRHHYSFLNGEMMLLHIYENQLKELTERNEANIKDNDNLLITSSNVNCVNKTSSKKHLVLPELTKSSTISDLCNKSRKVQIVPINSTKHIKIGISSLTKNESASDNSAGNTETDKICIVAQTRLGSSKKRKLHEISDPLSDEEEEKRRIGAINAKKNREVKKIQFDNLTQELLKEKNLNTKLAMQLKSLSDEKKIAVLEKENAELKYQILLDKYTLLLKLHNRCTKQT